MEALETVNQVPVNFSQGCEAAKYLNERHASEHESEILDLRYVQVSKQHFAS
jgi:hypothetical protein